MGEGYLKMIKTMTDKNDADADADDNNDEFFSQPFIEQHQGLILIKISSLTQRRQKNNMRVAQALKNECLLFFQIIQLSYCIQMHSRNYGNVICNNSHLLGHLALLLGQDSQNQHLGLPYTFLSYECQALPKFKNLFFP